MKSKKAGLFEFPLAAEEAFNELQKAFYSTPVLKHFNPVLPIQLETNASGFALAGILLQPFRNTGRNDTSWHSMIFWSQKMTDVKTHYKTHNDELLIIIMSFKH